jgi:hypothetical protein
VVTTSGVYRQADDLGIHNGGDYAGIKKEGFMVVRLLGVCLFSFNLSFGWVVGPSYAAPPEPPTVNANVINQPTVNLTPGTSVGVIGTPNVNISNTPTVNVGNQPTVTLGPGSSVEISGTPTLNFNVDQHREPVYLFTSIHSTGFSSTSGQPFYTVPSGKRLILELLSLQVRIPNGDIESQLGLSPENGASATIKIPTTFQSSLFGVKSYEATIPIHVYADAGTNLQLFTNRSSTIVIPAGEQFGNFHAFGYLVNMP